MSDRLLAPATRLRRVAAIARDVDIALLKHLDGAGLRAARLMDRFATSATKRRRFD